MPPLPSSTIPTVGAWPLPLSGTSVRLRPLRCSDLLDFQAYRTDHEVARYQGWAPMSDDAALAFVRSMEAVTGPRRGQWIQLGIATCADDRLIGDVGIRLSDDGEEAELGISCARAHQRQGVARDALRTLIDRLFGQGVRSVMGVVDRRNTPSLRLLDRLGFDATRIVATTFRGEPCVEVTYVLTPENHRRTQRADTAARA